MDLDKIDGLHEQRKLLAQELQRQHTSDEEVESLEAQAPEELEEESLTVVDATTERKEGSEVPCFSISTVMTLCNDALQHLDLPDPGLTAGVNLNLYHKYQDVWDDIDTQKQQDNDVGILRVVYTKWKQAIHVSKWQRQGQVRMLRLHFLHWHQARMASTLQVRHQEQHLRLVFLHFKRIVHVEKYFQSHVLQYQYILLRKWHQLTRVERKGRQQIQRNVIRQKRIPLIWDHFYIHNFFKLERHSPPSSQTV